MNLPEDAKEILDSLKSGSPASYAIRFAAGFEDMMMVLSGMSNMEQMKENIGFMKDFQPLNEQVCSQHLPIRKLLTEAAGEFENN